MSITLVYKRKGEKRKEVTLDTEAEIGRFVIYNQPMEIIATRANVGTPLKEMVSP